MKKPIPFALVGSGWRAEFFARVAKALPHEFALVGVVTRRPEKQRAFFEQFGAPSFNTADELLANTHPAFTVVSVAHAVIARVALDIAGRGMPVLMETPAGHTVEELQRTLDALPPGALFQVAEQYYLQPIHQARLNYMQKGTLGNIQQAAISFTNGYHAVSLMRKYLGLGFQPATVRAVTVPIHSAAGFSREGAPTAENIRALSHTIAVLDFGGKTGIYDFEQDQHRSFIRTQRVHIKGDRGELFNHDIRYMQQFNTPIHTRLVRENMGEELNMEGFGLKGIQAEGQWLYTNPYPYSRLSDDELGVAACLANMAAYVNGGENAYPFAQAAQDSYLALTMERAAREDCSLTTENLFG